MSTDKKNRLIVLNRHFIITKKLKKLFSKNHIDFQEVDINQLILNIRDYKTDILLIPEMVFEIIDSVTDNIKILDYISVILVSDDINSIWEPGKSYGSLYVADHININKSNGEIISILKKHLIQ